jgi:hypothetical protein
MWNREPSEHLAAVKNSFEIAVVGIGTSTWRPSSSASSMSFCIMLTLNHASGGNCSTNGPRYLIIGEATVLLIRTSLLFSFTEISSVVFAAPNVERAA